MAKKPLIRRMQYCECSRNHGFTRLEDTGFWVCGGCRLPKRLYWERVPKYAVSMGTRRSLAADYRSAKAMALELAGDDTAATVRSPSNRLLFRTR